jgi:hypothetical protein
MTTPIDLRIWAGALRRWAATVRDASTAEKMRRLADELEQRAALGPEGADNL